jgi:hypothetical protein
MASLREARLGPAPEPAEEEPVGSGEVSGDSPVSDAVPAHVEPSNADIRAWAADNNVDVNATGPIPKSVREAYDTAHQD